MLNKKLQTLKDNSGTNMDEERWIKSYQDLVDNPKALKGLGLFHNNVADELISAGLVQLPDIK